jgi:hypothetical protein
VARNPTLQVVGAIGGENFASGEIISKMCHSDYLSFGFIRFPLYTYIIPQARAFVKGFLKSFLIFLLPP